LTSTNITETDISTYEYNERWKTRASDLSGDNNTTQTDVKADTYKSEIKSYRNPLKDLIYDNIGLIVTISIVIVGAFVSFFISLNNIENKQDQTITKISETKTDIKDVKNEINNGVLSASMSG
jgi:hypothetical protein